MGTSRWITSVTLTGMGPVAGLGLSPQPETTTTAIAASRTFRDRSTRPAHRNAQASQCDTDLLEQPAWRNPTGPSALGTRFWQRGPQAGREARRCSLAIAG